MTTPGITRGILGIDPGVSGGLVLLSHEGRVLEKHVMPALEEGGLDLPGLGRLLYHLSDLADVALLEKPNGTVMTKGHGRGQSVASMFNFGKTCGAIEGMIAAFRIPYVLVHPATWTAALYKDQDRKLPSWHKGMVCFERHFPLEDFRASSRCQKPHDGMLDAALIATFGRLALRCDPIIPKHWHRLGAA